jgi:hypothetical protein
VGNARHRLSSVRVQAGKLISPDTVTPKQLGYTMPGEFEPHVECWMGWPYDKYLWREGSVPAKKQYAGVATAIGQFEPVTMLADPSVRPRLCILCPLRLARLVRRDDGALTKAAELARFPAL